MPDPSDDLEMKVLSELNSRTLVNGAAIDPTLLSDALKISPDDLRQTLSRLERAGYIRLDGRDKVGLLPAGHEYLSN